MDGRVCGAAQRWANAILRLRITWCHESRVAQVGLKTSWRRVVVATDNVGTRRPPIGWTNVSVEAGVHGSRWSPPAWSAFRLLLPITVASVGLDRIWPPNYDDYRAGFRTVSALIGGASLLACPRHQWIGETMRA
jgi:hypothetical protein